MKFVTVQRQLGEVNAFEISFALTPDEIDRVDDAELLVAVFTEDWKTTDDNRRLELVARLAKLAMEPMAESFTGRIHEPENKG